MNERQLKGAFLSTGNDEWATPSYIYRQVLELGMFDPCPLRGEIDGLSIEWEESNFVNPPYSKLRKWVYKSIEEAKKGKAVVLLIPARTETIAFRALWDYGARFQFITGRLDYNDCGHGAPFPSMLVYLTGENSTAEVVNKEDIRIWQKRR